MNSFLKKANKIEFAVTNACTGKCKHCSEGEPSDCLERIDPQIAAEAVRKIAAEYPIQMVMAFGGEPLLHTSAVYAIMQTAKELEIPKRQVITNGYFSNSADQTREVAFRLAECGVNDLLLSVDAFHQETIELAKVKAFALEAKKVGISMRLQPAWLISAADDNHYNLKTREILNALADLSISVGEGNIVFFEGNAKKYLAEYFQDKLPKNPYVEDPYNVRCISFAPNGDVLGGNVYQNDIMEIVNAYAPQLNGENK